MARNVTACPLLAGGRQPQRSGHQHLRPAARLRQRGPGCGIWGACSHTPSPALTGLPPGVPSLPATPGHFFPDPHRVPAGSLLREAPIVSLCLCLYISVSGLSGSQSGSGSSSVSIPREPLRKARPQLCPACRSGRDECQRPTCEKGSGPPGSLGVDTEGATLTLGGLTSRVGPWPASCWLLGMPLPPGSSRPPGHCHPSLANTTVVGTAGRVLPGLLPLATASGTPSPSLLQERVSASPGPASSRWPASSPPSSGNTRTPVALRVPAAPPASPLLVPQPTGHSPPPDLEPGVPSPPEASREGDGWVSRVEAAGCIPVRGPPRLPGLGCCCGHPRPPPKVTRGETCHVARL